MHEAQRRAIHKQIVYTSSQVQRSIATMTLHTASLGVQRPVGLCASDHDMCKFTVH